MPEMKRNFAKARMNKDTDERVMPAGEYKHALNVQVTTSDTGDVGALQNIQGNTHIASNAYNQVIQADTDFECVGMVPNPSTDKVYYFLRGNSAAYKRDAIMELDTVTDTLACVFLDRYQSTVTIPLAGTGSTFSIAANDTKHIRPGMMVNADVIMGDVRYYEVKSVTDAGLVTMTTDFPHGANESVVFHHPGVLGFGKLHNRYITGINILGDNIFWTDNVGEPKRINITKSKAGTGGTTSNLSGLGTGDTQNYHTRFVRSVPQTSNDLEIVKDGGVPQYVKEEDITVIRKSPTTAMRVNVSATVEQRNGTTSGTIGSALIWSGSHNVGSEISGLTFASPIFLKVDDIVTFTSLSGGTDSGYDIKARVTETFQDGDAGATSGHKFIIMTISPDLFGGFSEWQVRLVVGETLLDNKFARFSYRYKYDDGEYSTFAPWSKIAFLPGLYNWNSSVGYNEGMANNVRSITLDNFMPVNRPLGVVNIDVLYKETSSPTVYTVKTLSAARLSDYIADGYFELKSDLIHAVVESSQLLRPWDNVPRKALAQEVSANRVIYGNYAQGYNVPLDPITGFSINSRDLAYGGGDGSSSIKTLRNYKLGVVFSDKFGRETPVLAPRNIGNEGEINLPVTASSFSNTISANLKDNIPDWATHYSFYIKEPSVEYYTLAMDRWYAAADGDVWISFPSTERNKIDESTFLYLKKAHGSAIPVVNSKKYKVLSISNSAPNSIKMVYETFGRVQNTGVNNEQIGNVNIGYPTPGQRVISISKNQQGTGVEFGNIDLTNNYRIRFAENNATNFSSFYDVERISDDHATWYLHLRGPLGPDLEFSSSDNTWSTRIDDLTLIIYEGIPVNKPEFDGRFFVKISKDPDVENLITSFQGDDWVVFHEQEVGYINNNSYTNTLSAQPSLRKATDFNSSISTIADHPTEYSHLTPTYSWVNDSITVSNTDAETRNTVNLLNGDAESTRGFWEGMAGRFFIDRCSAYSWSGRVGAVPGSTYDLGNEATDTPARYDEQYWWTDDAGYSTSGQSYLETLWGLRYGDVLGSSFDQNEQFSAMTLNPGGYWNRIEYEGPNAGFSVTSSAAGEFFNAQPNLFLTALTNANDKTAGLPQGVVLGSSNNGGLLANRGTEFTATYGTTLLSTGGTLPSRGIWNDGSWGYMDLSFTGFSDSPMEEIQDGYIGYSEPGTLGYLSNGDGQSGFQDANRVCRISEDPDYQQEAEFIERLHKPGAKFRFKNDPDSIVYNVHDYPFFTQGIDHPDGKYYIHPDLNNTYYTADPWDSSIGQYAAGFHKHGHYGIRNYKTTDNTGQFEGSNLRQRWTLKVKPEFGSGPSGYRPDRGTATDDFTVSSQRALHHDGSNVDAIQVLTPATIDDDGNDISGGFVTNPAVWETRPAESADVDLYFEASDKIPLRLNKDTLYDFFPEGCEVSTTLNGESYIYAVDKVEHLAGAAVADGMVTRLDLQPINGWNLTPLTVAFPNNQMWKVQIQNGRCFSVEASGAIGDGYLTISNPEDLTTTSQKLTWSNCWSFGNGVESDRVRDDYNAPQVDNGVKASTVLGEKVQEETRAHGVIWSGIYNSNSGVNNTNQFIAAQKITKDLNPVYGSLQSLLNRDTRLIMFCEDKILRAVTNKDALYNADGNPQLVSSNTVIGDVVPYLGDFGISKNPESLAVAPVSAYFTDASRGRVLALSGEGVRPISAYGMEGYFSNLKNISSHSNPILGTFDSNTKEYNLTFGVSAPDTTVSYSERSKSWVSFKSFIPQAGMSLNNQYYTYANSHIWKHHAVVADSSGAANLVPYNNFYNTQHQSSVTTIFGDTSGGVKSFSTVLYEGSKPKVSSFTVSTQSIPTGDYSVNLGLDTNELTSDGEYFNLTDDKGWYMESMETDLQKAGRTEFVDKEGKWFGVPKGLVSYDASGASFKNVDTAEMSTQGLGVATSVSYSGTATGNVTMTIKNSSSSQSGDLWD